MKLNFSLAFLMLLIVCTVPKEIHAREAGTNADWPEQSVQNEAALAQALRRALHSLRSGVRVNYHAICRTGSYNQENVWFPRLVTDQHSNKTGLQAIREMLGANRPLTVNQTPTGLVHISAGTVEGALLKTRIHAIRLDRREQYDASGALGALGDTQEYQSAVQNLRLFEMPVMAAGPVAEPKPGAPHLPSILEDVSIDEFLDNVVRTFGGIISYGECVSPKSQTGCFLITYVRP